MPTTMATTMATTTTTVAVAAVPFVFFPLYQPSSRFFTNFWCRAGHNGSNEKPAKLVPGERLAARSLAALSIFLCSGCSGRVISIAHYAANPVNAFSIPRR